MFESPPDWSLELQEPDFARCDDKWTIKMVDKGCYNSKSSKPIKVLGSQPEILLMISNQFHPDASGADMMLCSA